MSKMLTILPTAIPKARAGHIVFAVLIGFCAAPWTAFAVTETPAPGATATLQLAAKIAGVDAGRDQNKTELLADYEKVYGDISTIPARWPALVRRLLVCQQVENQTCVHSSMEAIKTIGGANSFALNHLFEVSRFGMSADIIRARLHGADTGIEQLSKRIEKASKPIVNVAIAPPAPTTVGKAAPVRNVAASEAAVPITKKIAVPARPMVNAAVSTSSANANPAAPRTLLQKVSSRLGKMSAADTSGFFLDALFAMVAVSLLFALFLFSSMRVRKTERIGRLQALQEIQRLEELRGEEKLRSDHEIWSEQLKAEVTLEAQKAHAEERLKSVSHAAEGAILAERARATESIKAAQLGAEQLIQLEQSRVAEIIKVERLKTEEAQKSAKSRSDQAIDAYDQMAARELVFAHQRNDELQDALKAEQERREAQELKTEEALQAMEAMKVREAKLLDIIRGEQRVRASEARQAAEKLKAAQQAAVALQSSLVATRALKADLERRADEAMRAAELRIAEAQQNYANSPPSSAQPVPTVGESAGKIHTLEAATLGLNIAPLKDTQNG